MKILVVDEEPLARERLQRLLRKIRPEAQLLEAGNGEQAMEVVALEQPDLLLLDIRMPGVDGIEVASELQGLEQPPAIIFCTAFDRYAMQALEREAVAYLLKPVREEQLRTAIGKAGRVNRMQLAQLDEEQLRRTHITSDSRTGLQRVAVADIRCFIAEQKYVRACYREGELLIPETLKELEQEFAPELVRVHRNSLVAMTHVVGLRREDGDGWCVELDGVSLRPAVSRRHLSDVRKTLRER